jgi:hypothetical protein
MCGSMGHKLMIRLVAGVSSGLAVCLVPPFLSLIARSTPELASKTGFIGTMNQIGIVTGLFGGQVAGLALTGSVSFTLPLHDAVYSDADHLRKAMSLAIGDTLSLFRA